MASQGRGLITTRLMTVHVPLEPEKIVSRELRIHNSRPGGWVKGPAISGEVVAPTADWMRLMPNGTCRLDVRLTILADDGNHIFMSYAGRIVMPEQHERMPRPSPHVTPADRYFMTNPVFETDSPKYAWLNNLIAVGRIIPSPDPEVTYEVYAVD